MAAAQKKSLLRVNLGKMSGWLPAVAVFLCLSMFATVALILLQVGSDPESPPSAVVTSVSAQGFQGLRRLLDAEGYTTDLNRYEDGPNVVRGDLEIITLDAPVNYYGMFYQPQDSSSSAGNSEEPSDETADEDYAPQAAASSSSVDTGPGALDDSFYPYPKQSKHMLYAPFGRAILVVAPKWTAAYDTKNTRWARGPKMASDTSIRDMLAELSPMSEVPAKFDNDKYIPPEVAPGKASYLQGKNVIIYDKVPYDISHDKATARFTLRSVGGGELDIGTIANLQSITAPNLVPVWTTTDGRPILSRVVVTEGRAPTKVPVYLLSDPDLLNNQILSDPKRVASGLALIKNLTPPVKAKPHIIFNVTFNGLSFNRDLIHALSRPPFLAVPLAMLILALALMWSAFARFGPAQEAPAGPPLGRGVRTLADNAARLMALTLKEARLGPAYATLMRDMVIRSRGYMQVDPGQSLDDLAERIGKTHGAADSYLDLRDKAARVATVHQLIDVTLKLHAWKTEIERAHI
ncbi:MAG: hypothetical protein JF615_01325 [Asticcacaulis sp.]|nr:hypothetical protein [Asticcacaulis sp.]